MLPVAPMTRILISMLLICGVHRRPAAPPTLGRGRRRMSTASGLWSAPERGRAGRDDLAVGKQIVHPASRAAQPRPRVQADQRVDGDGAGPGQRIPLPEPFPRGPDRRGVPQLPWHEDLGGVAAERPADGEGRAVGAGDRKSTRLNSSHVASSYAVFCLKKKTAKDLACDTNNKTHTATA